MSRIEKPLHFMLALASVVFMGFLNTVLYSLSRSSVVCKNLHKSTHDIRGGPVYFTVP